MGDLKGVDYYKGIYQLNKFDDKNGNVRYQLIRLASLRNCGVDIINNKNDFSNYIVEYENENNGKSAESLSRVKRVIYELSFCNSWEWFFTGTLNPDKNNVFDLNEFHKKLTKFISNFNFFHNTRIKFLFIPEKHKSGAWHVHGFLMGLDEKYLTEFTLDDFIPYGLLKKIKKGEKIYHWKSYEKHFGFCDLEKIRNHEAIAKYMTKYVTKDLQNGVNKLGAHCYYCSRGLRRKEIVCRGFCSSGIELKPSFHSDYVTIWDNLSDDDVEILKNSLVFDNEIIE